MVSLFESRQTCAGVLAGRAEIIPFEPDPDHTGVGSPGVPGGIAVRILPGIPSVECAAAKVRRAAFSVVGNPEERL